MKRILFVGLIALLVLLAVPAAMAATEAGFEAKGEVLHPTIDVSISSGSFDFGYLITGATCNEKTSGTPTVTATIGGAGLGTWAVTASTPDVGSPVPMGRMYVNSWPYDYLDNYFMLGSQSVGYDDLDPARVFMSGGSTDYGAYYSYLKMYQCINAAHDVDGVYQMDITFTGTVTGAT